MDEMKKAYVIAEIRVTNPVGYQDYLPLSTASIQNFGGKFIVRGGTRAQLEGSDPAHNDGWRTVVAEFPSLERAQEWYASAEYAKAKAVRQANSEGRLFIVEGVELG
jgi:uncharacterized protein (DUF1330 family)